LSYVYFSRFKGLLTKEASANDPLFDYLIDVGEGRAQTGRLIGVEVLNGTPVSVKSFADQYKNIPLPILLLVCNNKTDDGYSRWIKEPKNDGSLLLDYTKDSLTKLESDSLNKIVQQVKDWHEH
jgi:hypothetical protein